MDALGGLQVFDGIEIAAMHHPPINPDYPALLGQVYSQTVASDIKLTLMNQYPDDFPVKLIHGAGTDTPLVEDVPLYELDRSEHIRHMTTLYLPALGNMSSFEHFSAYTGGLGGDRPVNALEVRAVEVLAREVTGASCDQGDASTRQR